MNKIEFIAAVAEKTGYTKTDTRNLLEATLDTIVETVANGENVQLTGFGTFKSCKIAARTGLNLQTNKTVKYAATVVPRFKPGTAFKATVKAKKKSKK